MPTGLFHTKYRTDERIFQTLWVRAWILVFFILMLIYPFVVSKALLSFTNVALIFILGSVGINLLTGFAGQITFAHGAFIGVGAYSSALFMIHFKIPFLLSMILAGFFTSLVGMIFGLPSLRVKGFYLILATMAAQLIIEWCMYNLDFITQGSTGLIVPKASMMGFVFDSDRKYFYLLFAVVTLGVIFARNLFRTRVGRAFIAIRDRDIAAELLGVNLWKYKLMAFGLSTFYAGITGSLWGHYVGIISPEHFPLWLSLYYLGIIIVGGLGSILGSIFGAIFMTALPEILRITASYFGRIYPGIIGAITGLQEAVFGLIIIAFLIFEPDGLAERWRTIKAYWKLWPFSY